MKSNLSKISKKEEKEILWKIYYSSLIIAFLFYPDNEAHFCLGWATGFEAGYNAAKIFGKEKINFREEREKNLKHIQINFNTFEKTTIFCIAYNTLLDILNTSRIDICNFFSHISAHEIEILKTLLIQVRKEMEKK